MKTHLRVLATITACTGSPALIAAPFLSLGENAEMFLKAGAAVRYEDNLYLAPSNEVDDIAFRFTPGVELVFGKNSLLSGSVEFVESINRYVEETANDNELMGVYFDANYEGAATLIKSSASYEELSQNTLLVAGVGTLVRYDVINFSVDAERELGGKSKLGAGFAYNDNDYLTAGLTDNHSYSVPLNYFYAITPKVDLSVGLRYRDTTVDGGSDYEDTYYNVGARGAFTAKLSGSFTVGYSLREPEVGDNTSTLGMDAGLSYLYSPKTSFSLSAGNDFGTSAIGGASQRSFHTTLGASTQFTAALAGQAGLTYRKVDYSSGIDRHDDYYSGDLSLIYTYSKHLSFTGAYSYQDNESTGAQARPFTANVVAVSAMFRY